LQLFSFGCYGLALAALALVVFGAYDSYPKGIIFYCLTKKMFHSFDLVTRCVLHEQILRFLYIGARKESGKESGDGKVAVEENW